MLRQQQPARAGGPEEFANQRIRLARLLPHGGGGGGRGGSTPAATAFPAGPRRRAASAASDAGAAGGVCGIACHHVSGAHVQKTQSLRYFCLLCVCVKCDIYLYVSSSPSCQRCVCVCSAASIHLSWTVYLYTYLCISYVSIYGVDGVDGGGASVDLRIQQERPAGRGRHGNQAGVHAGGRRAARRREDRGRGFQSVVSAEGRVWTFGWGWNSCLGHNDEQSRLLPTLLAEEVFKGSKIVTMAAGGYHTIVGERSAVGVGQGILWPAGPGRHQQQKRCGRGARDPTASWAWATPTTGALPHC